MSLAVIGDPRATFVFPVYNGGAFLERTLETARAWLAARHERWEMIVVDDASTDGTPAILAGFLRRHRDEAIRSVRLDGNRGKGYATRIGIGLARGRDVVFTDCDLAYPMDNVARILERLEAGAEAAIACRVLPASTYMMSPSFFSYLYTRHLMGRVFNWICRLLTVPRLLDTQAGLKGFRTETIRPLLATMVLDGFSFDVELLRALLDRGVRIEEVPVSFRYDSEPSTVRFTLDSVMMLRDLLRVRVRSLRGVYRDARPAQAPIGLVVNADDFGLAPGINRAIMEGLEGGVLTRASILLGGPHAAEALAWAAAHPRHRFGVHLNLTQGTPILPPERIPSLVDRRGRFRGLGPFLARFAAGRIRMSEVRAEWRAQVAAVRTAGVEVGHLDSHQHVHLLPRLFRRALLPIARPAGLAVRVMDGPAGRAWSDPKGVLLGLATRRAVRGGDGAAAGPHGFGTSFMKRPTLRRVRALLSRTRPGRVYEFVVHPGVADAELRASGDGYLEGREIERQILASEEFRALVHAARIDLLPLAASAAAPPAAPLIVPDAAAAPGPAARPGA